MGGCNSVEPRKYDKALLWDELWKKGRRGLQGQLASASWETDKQGGRQIKVPFDSLRSGNDSARGDDRWEGHVGSSRGLISKGYSIC